MLKKFLLALCALILIFAQVALANNAKPEHEIIILYTNDVHCGVESQNNLGYAGLAYYRDEMLKLTPYVTLVDAGDAVQGDLIGAISNGRYIIEIMNACSYDIAVPGNHEFDYDMPQFFNSAKNLNCGYISCNFRDANNNLIFKPYKIFNYNNIKVAFIGICTPASLTTSTPTFFMNEQGEYIYDFDGDLTGKKLYNSVQDAVNKARQEGADFIIAVAHLGEEVPVNQLQWSALRVAANTRGIDVIIDGHSHELTPCLKVKNLDSQDVIITQTGTKFKTFGKLTINTQGEISTQLITQVSSKDLKVDKVIKDIKSRYEAEINEPIAYTSFDLIAVDENNKWLVRAGETNLCNFVADAILYDSISRVKELQAIDSRDIAAFINAGNIRKTLKTGALSYASALSVSPFGNTLLAAQVSGQTILDELELAAAAMPKNSGGFLHVANMTFTIDARVSTSVQLDEHNIFIGVKENAERRIKDAKINNKAIEPDKIYIVITSNYVLRDHGDGHRFQDAKFIVQDYETVADATAHYMKALKFIPEKYKVCENRITIIK
ncbi:MAG: bifunctional metallophosphatase/5'-nucleotidase [Synergistaceae bacterium]|nr:bifunctional metallophosphatase/5'-nucleotidase [Synergistaceae bacterium]